MPSQFLHLLKLTSWLATHRLWAQSTLVGDQCVVQAQNTTFIAGHIKSSFRFNNRQYNYNNVVPTHAGTNAAWNTFIHKQMPKWISYFIHLIVESNRTTLVVLYENFQQDRVREVSRILDFIYFPYERKSLAEKLQNDFDVFQRKQHVEFEAFTELQIEYIDRQLRALLHRLNTANSGVTFGIEEYLRNPI